LAQIFRGAVPKVASGEAASQRGTPTKKKVEGQNPLASREPDRDAWVGEGEVDYQ